ncbi:GNAT family N-acetyltransferase [Salinicoccus albus]|uniref:GNAT family N-acetyltransferase n=1 Tax=Salinicoccus albus TaxID=418756 RepID=UPI000372CE14|nr:GNAT family N-acetyltransferase [Salinicoccus albus]
MEIRDLSKEDLRVIERGLERYNEKYMPDGPDGSVQIGLYDGDNQFIGGVDAEMTVDTLLYVSTLYVKDEYRGRGAGTALMKEVERQAIEIGAEIIRLDSFSWEGVGFYETLGYEVIGAFEIRAGFKEYFYMKRLK